MTMLLPSGNQRALATIVAPVSTVRASPGPTGTRVSPLRVPGGTGIDSTHFPSGESAAAWPGPSATGEEPSVLRMNIA